MGTGVFKGTDMTIIGMSPQFKVWLNRVQGAGFDPSWDTEEHGQYGDRTPIEINKEYNGVSGSVDIEVTASPNDAYPSDNLLCLLTDQTPDPASATVTGFDPADYEKFDLLLNAWDGDPADITEAVIRSSSFIKQCEVSGAPKDSSLDGVVTKTVDYDAVTGIDFRGALTICQIILAGAYTETGVIGEGIGWDPTDGAGGGGAVGVDQMDAIYSPKKRGTVNAGQIDALDAGNVGTEPAALCVAAMKAFKNKYHVYAGAYIEATSTWKILTEAHSSATEFFPGENLVQDDIVRVVILFDDATTIV